MYTLYDRFMLRMEMLMTPTAIVLIVLDCQENGRKRSCGNILRVRGIRCICRYKFRNIAQHVCVSAYKLVIERLFIFLYNIESVDSEKSACFHRLRNILLGVRHPWRKILPKNSLKVC